MIFTIEKTYHDGRVFNFHSVVETKIDMGAFSVSIIINSWQTEQDALAKAENYVTFIARTWHAYWSPSHLEELETQALTLDWLPYKSGFEVAPTMTLPQAKENKRKEINSQRDILEKSGFAYLTKTIDSDITSVIRISIAAQSAQAALAASQPFSIVWTAQDNTAMTLNASEMIGMSIALAEHANELHTHAKDKKVLIDSAETIEEVEAITWD